MACRDSFASNAKKQFCCSLALKAFSVNLQTSVDNATMLYVYVRTVFSLVSCFFFFFFLVVR